MLTGNNNKSDIAVTKFSLTRLQNFLKIKNINNVIHQKFKFQIFIFSNYIENVSLYIEWK